GFGDLRSRTSDTEPAARVDREQVAVVVFDHVGDVGVGFEKAEDRLGFFRREGGTEPARPRAGDFRGVEVGDEPVVFPRRIDRPASVAAHPGDRDVSEIVNRWQQVAGFLELRYDEFLIESWVGASMHPVGDRVAARATVEKVYRAE